LQTDRCRPTLPCLAQSVFVAENAPRGTAINYYLKSNVPSGVKISISDITGRVLCTADGPGSAGINRVQWTLSGPPRTGTASARGANGASRDANCSGNNNSDEVAPGAYTVKLSVVGHDYAKVVQVLEDRWLEER
jgi:hypothetical protein